MSESGMGSFLKSCLVLLLPVTVRVHSELNQAGTFHSLPTQKGIGSISLPLSLQTLKFSNNSISTNENGDLPLINSFFWGLFLPCLIPEIKTGKFDFISKRDLGNFDRLFTNISFGNTVCYLTCFAMKCYVQFFFT